jgi:4'-phosphopantetheinyl transferase
MRDVSLHSKGTSPSFFLSTTEHQIYAGLKMEKRRREWLLGRWTAKQLLQRSREAYRCLPLTAITIDNDADGAPFFAVEKDNHRPERLSTCLSISHRGENAFCALSDTHAIGADIERVETRHPAFVHDFFTERETACVWHWQTARDLGITVMWSVKESVLKVLREGLRVDTRHVEITRIDGLQSDGQGYRPAPSSGIWHPVQVRCSLPDTPRFAAWWRPRDDCVLSLAAALPDTGAAPPTLAIRCALASDTTLE